MKASETSKAAKVVAPDVEILKDPYVSDRPYKVLKDLPSSPGCPQGWALGWKWPAYRDRRGWNGWEIVKWSLIDKENIKLGEYLGEPPIRMQGADHIDDTVRRGSDVLCRIPRHWLDQRQEEKRIKRQKQLDNAGAGGTQRINDIASLTGPGMQTEEGVTFKTPSRSEIQNARARAGQA